MLSSQSTLPGKGEEAPVLPTPEQYRVYVEAGQWAQAEEWLGTMVASQPDDAEAREFLVQVLERKGDGAGAALQYGRALELRTAGQAVADAEPIRHLYNKVKELAPASPIVSKLSACLRPLRLRNRSTTSMRRRTTPLVWRTRTWGWSTRPRR